MIRLSWIGLTEVEWLDMANDMPWHHECIYDLNVESD